MSESTRDSTSDSTSEPARRLPPQAEMGLLGYITATALDEDYAHVAERRRAAAEAGGETSEAGPSGARNRHHVLAVIALVLFGLVVATAALQTSRSAGLQEQSRAALIAEVKERRSELETARAEIDDLRGTIEQEQADYLRATASGRALAERLETLEAASGLGAVRGPGVRIVVDDVPGGTTEQETVLDRDLQKLVNGLWAAGAEAVAINGQRLTNLSAIRTGGSAILVNYRALNRPYVVRAVGNPDQLPARFIETEGGTWWLNLKSVYKMPFTMISEDSLTLPAAAPVTLRHAQVPRGDR